MLLMVQQAPFNITFGSGLNSLASLLVNTLVPGLGAFFVVMAIVSLSQSNGLEERYIFAAILSLLVKGIYLLLQSYAAQGPTAGFIALIGYTGNVLMPIYAGWNLIKGFLSLGGVLESVIVKGEPVRYFIVAFLSLMVAGVCHLLDKLVIG